VAGFQDTEPYQIIWNVRRLFRALAQRSNQLLTELDLNAADRAALEFLYPNSALSVPEIAERYQVSRQHIQVTVNALQAKGLVGTRPNPRHKRSQLIELTKAGRMRFETILKRDEEAIESLFAGLTAEQVSTTRATLAALLDQLKE
jgi:DNA-binding MarR family transcriptional regulator